MWKMKIPIRQCMCPLRLWSPSFNHTDPHGSFRHAAASYAHLDLLEYLISKGGDINHPDSDGETPLFTVEAVEVAKWMIERGAKIDVKNHEGETVRLFDLLGYCFAGPGGADNIIYGNRLPRLYLRIIQKWQCTSSHSYNQPLLPPQRYQQSPVRVALTHRTHHQPTLQHTKQKHSHPA